MDDRLALRKLIPNPELPGTQAERNQRFLGWFDNPSDAATAYAVAADELHGEFKRLR